MPKTSDTRRPCEVGVRVSNNLKEPPPYILFLVVAEDTPILQDLLVSPELIIHSHLPIIQNFCSHHFSLLFKFSLAYYSNNFDLLFNLYSEVGKSKVQYKNETM